MFEIWILQHIGARGRFRYEYFGIARGKLFRGTAGGNKPAIMGFAAATLLALVFGTGQINLRDEIIPEHPAFASFPLSFGTWRGHEGSLQPDILQALQLSDYWIADYRRGEKESLVNLYVAYYASQRAGVTTHSPSNCIPGGGWQIADSRVVTVPVAAGATITLTRLLIRRGEDAELVYYWFDERGRILTETTIAKAYLLWDSIFMHRTDGALIRLVTPLQKDEGEAGAERRLNEFLGAVLPEVGRFVPGGR